MNDIVLASDSPFFTATSSNTEENIAFIRTSGRSLFKRCRRKFDFESELRKNLTPIDRPSYFWLGTGGHFAMEDWHGHNYYGDPVKAFQAYCIACGISAKHGPIQLPEDFEEQKELGEGILANYLMWSSNRDTYETVWLPNSKGISEPCVEVKCLINLTDSLPKELLDRYGYDKIFYRLTLDRLILLEDEYWITDWKFFKAFSQGDLVFNGQMSAYIWAAQAMWDVPVVGAIYHEFLKTVPKPARVLKNGQISAAKDQLTTHAIYRDALITMYGNENSASATQIHCLNEMAAQEGPDRDRFIRRSKTRRTQRELESEGSKIILELEEMLNPDLPMYSNPTRDCSWACHFREPCLMMDRGDDWKFVLNETTVSREDENDDWRKYLPTLEEL